MTKLEKAEAAEEAARTAWLAAELAREELARKVWDAAQEKPE